MLAVKTAHKGNNTVWSVGKLLFCLVLQFLFWIFCIPLFISLIYSFFIFGPYVLKLSLSLSLSFSLPFILNSLYNPRQPEALTIDLNSHIHVTERDTINGTINWHRSYTTKYELQFNRFCSLLLFLRSKTAELSFIVSRSVLPDSSSGCCWSDRWNPPRRESIDWCSRTAVPSGREWILFLCQWLWRRQTRSYMWLLYNLLQRRRR